ncbi:MAG: PQQ-binding-like beta-propeller repeat protein [Planctomycetes bacterium]|nr:PQQ-binding-like beta-propeller repeat protein [Planctomycetota bacterium]
MFKSLRVKKYYAVLVTCYLLLVTCNLFAEDWPSLSRDTSRQRSTQEKLSSAFSAAWQYAGSSDLPASQAGIVSSPAIADGVVVFAARDNFVRAIKESDGSLLWSFLSGDEIIASPSISNGRVYIPSTDGKIYCLNLSNGALIWNYRTGGTEFSSPVISDNTLYMGSGFPNAKVIAIDALTKQFLWETQLEQIVYSSPAISGTVLVVGCNSGKYYALDKTTGEIIWSCQAGGQVMLSSPLVVDDSAYLLPGGTNLSFYRVAINQADWATNYQILLSDPLSPAGSTILNTKLNSSSPVKIGNLIGFTARFDYFIDTNADSIVDQYTLNEYIIAIDPAAHSIKWQKNIGARITADQNKIPPLGLCPAPATMSSASGELIVTASSLAEELRIINPADGETISIYPLDDACQSSPAIANGKIFIATKKGSVYAFRNDGNRAPSPPTAGFTPADNATITSTTPAISWNAAVDPDAGDPSNTLSYLVRVDDDGEILLDYDYITATLAGVTSITLPSAITDNTNLTYAVRAIDASLAYSEWSEAQSFWINRAQDAPLSPTNFRAEAGNGYVDLFWQSSASQDVQRYLLAYKEEGGSYNAPINAGNTTNYRVNGLTNGTMYTFQIIAEDYDALQSAPLEISARPLYPIMVNTTPYNNLIYALAQAQSGDTVRLGVGTFVINSTLSLKQGVNLAGYSPHHTILNGTGLDRLVLLTAGAGITSTISNLTLYGAHVGIDTSGDNALIRNTVIRNCNIGIFAGSGSDTSIINNTIINNSIAGIYANSSQCAIRNNIIMYNGDGVYAATGIIPAITYNDAYQNTVNYNNASPGIGNISLHVVFLDEPNKDYRVVLDQPTIDMGAPSDDYLNEPHPRGTRVNMGAYGNTIYAATSGPFSIADGTLSNSETGAYYSALLSTLGGSGPVTWTIFIGSIPPGLNLNTSTGDITGTIQLGSAGLYNFTARAVDFLDNNDTADFSIQVSQISGNTLHFVTNALSSGYVRATYKTTVSVAGGFPPYAWSITNGGLPPNFTLNSATGEIIGTPPYGTDNTYGFTVQVKDADNFTVSGIFNITINAGQASGSSAEGGAGKTWCFIATAAYGSPLAPGVMALRHFREKYLLTNSPGKWLVAQYYKNSPPLAQYIGQHNWAKRIAQVMLIPVVAYGWFMVSTGWMVKLITCIGIMILGIFLIRRLRRIRSAKRTASNAVK